MGTRGPKAGSGGRPKKPITEKIADGNPGKRKLTVIDFKDSAADLEGQDMPKPSEFLSAKQKDGSQLCAAEIYKNTWEWLSVRGCATLISPQLIERYAMASARWIQCESVTSELGFLGKAPNNRCGNSKSICCHCGQIHDTSESSVVGDLWNRP